MWPKKRASPAISDYDRFEVKSKGPGGLCFFMIRMRKKCSQSARLYSHLVKHRGDIAAMVCAVIHNMPDHIGICRLKRPQARMRNRDRTFRVLHFF